MRYLLIAQRTLVAGILLSGCGGDGTTAEPNCLAAFEESPLWSFEWNVAGVTDDTGEIETFRLDLSADGDNVVDCNSSAVFVDDEWVYTYDCPPADLAGRATLNGDELSIVLDATGEVGEVRFLGTLNGTCDEVRGTSMADGTSGTLVGIPVAE